MSMPLLARYRADAYCHLATMGCNGRLAMQSIDNQAI